MSMACRIESKGSYSLNNVQHLLMLTLGIITVPSVGVLDRKVCFMAIEHETDRITFVCPRELKLRLLKVVEYGEIKSIYNVFTESFVDLMERNPDKAQQLMGAIYAKRLTLKKMIEPGK